MIDLSVSASKSDIKIRFA